MKLILKAIGNVTFAPGARNNWHSHKVGRVLLVTGGEGWYQEKGKPAKLLKTGDGETEWLEPVDDAWYGSL
ncbi:hypothetical protein [Paenibacillus sp. P3E]|uniref:hypothetical protein n=1 Tax=Paenibacillus sp. P3E TaxID=1349435 RepID=UPI000AAE04FB